MELAKPNAAEAPQAPGAPAGTAEAAGGGSSGSDSLLIHPYVWPAAPLKAPLLGKLKKLAQHVVDKKEGAAYIQALEAARSQLGAALESPAVSEQAVTDAAARYIALLLGAISSSSGGKPAVGGSAAAAEAASPDEALAAAEAGAGSAGGAGSPLAGPPSKLRNAGAWEWGDAALVAPPPGAPPRTAASSDALFELAQVLVATAVRLMHAASLAAQDSASGVTTPNSTRAYNLLRQAAGILEYAVREVLPSLPLGAAADLDPQLLRALASTALADAQQLTLLRAVVKGNQPPLIAALAADSAELYALAGSQVGSSTVPGAAASKLAQYAKYKQAYARSYAHTFNGIALWKSDKCGAGLKSLDAAAAELKAAKAAAGAYDAAPPATLNLHHRRVDEELERVLNDTQRRMKRENDAVFMQPVPSEAPPLPDGKRLVSSVAYALPQPAAEVKDGVVDRCFAAGPAAAGAAMQAPAVATMSAGGAAAGAGAAATAGATAGGDGGTQAEQGCSCCRWLVFLLTAPILVALWLVGAVLWVVLLPLKLCCPCCGLPIGWAASLVLWLLALPARGLRYAAGSPFEDKQSGDGKEQGKK